MSTRTVKDSHRYHDALEQVVNHQSKNQGTGPSGLDAHLAHRAGADNRHPHPIAQSLYQSLFGRPRLKDDGFFSTTEPFVGLKLHRHLLQRR